MSSDINQLSGARSIGSKRLSILLVLLALLLSALLIPLKPTELVPSASSWKIAKEFFLAAFNPAWSYEAPSALQDYSLWQKVGTACWTTLKFATATTALSLLIGLPLGIAGSRLWSKKSKQAGVASRPLHYLSRGARVLQALLRSVHELIWAMIFLAALGVSEAVAVVAVAIPYSGVLGKIFSEIIDETPTSANTAVTAIGGNALPNFFQTILPRVAPDMLSYLFYRFECA